jgi:hypothetical protein
LSLHFGYPRTKGLIFKAENIPRLFVKEKEEMPGVIIDTRGAGAIDAGI